MKTTHYVSLLLVSCLFFYGCSGNQGTGEETASDTTAAMQQPEVTVSLEEAWKTDTVMRTPESVLYDKEQDAIYVANINGINKENKDGDGFIAKLSTDGSVEELQWVSGLNDPKGMGIHEGKLYVTDLDEIVEINIETGEIENKYPVEGASFLNDITVGNDGKVYATDSDKDKIHVLENGQVSTWMEDSSLQRPNGLLIAEDGELLLASAGGGFLAPIDTAQKTVQEHWVDNIPSADGIIQTEDGNYIVSTWQGEVHYVEASSGSSQKILDTKAEEINSADIGYNADQSLLLIPTFNDNRVVAYKINKEDS